MAAFGGFVGAAGRRNPLLRPGFNVNFMLPGMSADFPARKTQVTATPLLGPVYPVRPTYAPLLDVGARSITK